MMAVATTTTMTTHAPTKVLSRHLRPKTACFSFAAYAKSLVEHLISCNVPVLQGLTDAEFASIESMFSFTFPPDLRSILQEGLPVGPGFTNWRASSPQQLQILTNLPIRCLIKEVRENNFWCDAWGAKPTDDDEAADKVKRLSENAPFLVPICRYCYIPSSPNVAGNPVFYINGGEVRVLSFDLDGFFQEMERLEIGVLRKATPKISSPAWAATEPRRIEFWSDVAETGKRMESRGETHGWWCSDSGGGGGGQLGVCLEEVFWRLRDGGWREEDVREMMSMDGCDDSKKMRTGSTTSVVGHVRAWSLELLRAGWSREDVVDSLGIDCQGQDEEKEEEERSGGGLCLSVRNAEEDCLCCTLDVNKHRINATPTAAAVAAASAAAADSGEEQAKHREFVKGWLQMAQPPHHRGDEWS